MYKKLGAKLVVGMPFKDQACSDTLVLHQVPPASDTQKRRALARLQVGRCDWLEFCDVFAHRSMLTADAPGAVGL